MCPVGERGRWHALALVQIVPEDGSIPVGEERCTVFLVSLHIPETRPLRKVKLETLAVGCAMNRQVIFMR